MSNVFLFVLFFSEPEELLKKERAKTATDSCNSGRYFYIHKGNFLGMRNYLKCGIVLVATQFRYLFMNGRVCVRHVERVITVF